MRIEFIAKIDRVEPFFQELLNPVPHDMVLDTHKQNRKDVLHNIRSSLVVVRCSRCPNA